MLRTFLAILSSLTLLYLASPADAQQVLLPSLIRIVVPASPGSGTDALARVVATQLTSRTGSQFIVENKPGASTLIGSAAVANGPKDGSVLLINSTTLLSAGATMKIRR